MWTHVSSLVVPWTSSSPSYRAILAPLAGIAAALRLVTLALVALTLPVTGAFDARVCKGWVG